MLTEIEALTSRAVVRHSNRVAKELSPTAVSSCRKVTLFHYNDVHAGPLFDRFWGQNSAPIPP
ncbi:hypothetical protein DPMN_078827 [Dreissena polymorpha]|uniref:Uncharacterized protein n=1 Tax=Dreissena polymorpha TaxID=45954 RepID=A0A9D3YRB5_DREPO|nr:hypothetical protein DPMN_078817 [Dreissena polymorpha]KAH3703780.1 hypothetical protein DPMN_078827 [Dreissena polymorpha]